MMQQDLKIRRRRNALRLESLESRVLLTAVGEINSGIAVDDDATGTGYLMFSAQDVHTRFSPAPVIANSDHLVAVRYQGGSWQYNDNLDWHSFTPVATDHLLAEVDFGADTINTYQCISGTINGIDHGFANDDLGFFANEWNEEFNNGEFTITGTSFDTSWTECGSVVSISPDTGPTDLVTSAQNITLSGRFDGAGALTVDILGTTHNPTTTGPDWSLALTNVPEGTHDVDVFVGGSFVATKKITIDTTNPFVSIASVSPDTGAADFVTTENRVLLIGTYEQGGDLELTFDGRTYRLGENPQLTSNGSGTWTLDVTSIPLLGGTYTADAVATDLAGNTASDSQSVQIITATIDTVIEDTGPAEDFVTDDQEVIITGSITPGASINVDVIGGISLTNLSPVVLGNTWTLDLTGTTLPMDTYVVTANVSLGGNNTSVSRDLNITNDCFHVESYELRDPNDNPISSLATIELGLDGTPNVTIDLNSRMISPNNTYYVDDNYSGTISGPLGSSTNPYTDLHIAFDDIDGIQQLDLGNITVNGIVPDGTYEYVRDTNLTGGRDARVDVTIQNNIVTSVTLRNRGRDYLGGSVAAHDLSLDLIPEPNGQPTIFEVVIPVAAANNESRATINVAAGDYIWGLQGNVGFDVNLIGAGIGQTVVKYDTALGTDPLNTNNRYVAQFRQNETYIEGFTFDGESDGTTDSFIVMDVRSADALTIVDSELMNAGVGGAGGDTGGDGLNVFDTDTVVVSGSTAHHNDGDGFSYSNPNGQSMEVLELFVNGSDNGLQDPDNDGNVIWNDNWNAQGSTTHESVDIVRVGGVFERNPTNISDVSNGTSWNVDVTTGFAQANEQAGQYLNFNISGGGTAWIVGGSHGNGFSANRPTVVNAQPGAEIRYVGEFSTLDPVSTIVTGGVVEDNQVLVPNSVPCTASITIDSITRDTGAPDDFVTFDQELLIKGSFVGTDVSVTFDGTTYSSSSPELTLGVFEWTLDLTNQVLPHGTYSVSAVATDGFAGSATANDTVTVDCNQPVDAYLSSVLGYTDTALTMDSAGRASVDIDLEARKTVSANVFYVDARKAVTNPTGSQAAPFTDLPDVFDHIKTNGLLTAEIIVAAGDYTWGDAINPDNEPLGGPFFRASLTVIGAGPGLTKVYQGTTDKAAGLFSEGGKSLYVEGMSFIGLGDDGVKNVNEHAFEATGGVDLTFVNTVFTDASDGDGLFVGNFDNVVVYESQAIRNDSDGFSYTKTLDGGLSMFVTEIGVIAAANGQNGEASSQGSTAHRDTRIVRLNGTYANNPANIEDTNLASWNIGLDVKNPTVFQSNVGDYVNVLVRGDKIEATDGLTWLVSGNYNEGGVVHARATTANNNTPVVGRIRHTSRFDILSHPIGSVMTEDQAGLIQVTPDDSQFYTVTQPCDHFLTLDIDADWISETGATTATVTRHSGVDISRGLTVTLTPSDPSELHLPATVRIPSGQLSTQFTFTASNDYYHDGTKTVSIAASASDYISGVGATDTIDVRTLSPVELRVDPRSIDENGSASAIVRRTSLDTSQELTVLLSVSDSSELTAPASVVIPSGQIESAAFTISGVSDNEVDGDQIASVTASVLGYGTTEMPGLNRALLLQPFDSGAPIDAIGTNNGTLVDGAKLQSDPEMGTVLSVDGTHARLEIPHESDLNIGDGNANFSVAFWIKLEETHNGSFRLVAQKGSNGTERTFGMWLRPNDNRLTFRISTTHSTNEGGVSNSSLPVGQWTHVTYVKLSDKIRLYINGVFDKQANLIGDSVSNNGVIQIGGTSYNSWEGAKASYDDFYVVRRVLSAAEVSELSNQHIDATQGFVIDDSLITASYDFNGDTTDTTNSFDGELVGGTLVNDSQFGEVLSVGGSNRLEIPHDPALEVGKSDNDFSIAYWVKLESDHNGTFRLMTQKGNNGTERTFAMWLRPNDNRMTYRISTDVSANEGGVSSTALVVGQWTHISYVKKDSTLSLYVNGELDSSKQLQGEVISNNGVIQIGGASYNAYLGADAKYDDYLIFNDALTSLEVAVLASQHDPRNATQRIDVADTDS